MWEFFREDGNCAYIKDGDISYKNCSNNLVISSQNKNRFVDLKDSFVFIEGSNTEITPISDIPNVLQKASKVLYNQKIHYNIPKVVWDRENLAEKDIEKLKKEIKKNYGIEPKDFSTIRNGIFYFKLGDKEYVLKFRGKDKKRAELLSHITESIPNYFPINFHRIDNLDFTFEIGEELYGLEEFIGDTDIKTRDLEYFALLGNNIGLLHNHFSDFIDRNKEVKRVLFSMGSYNESSMISIYLDLLRDKQKHEVLLSELEKIIYNHENNVFLSRGLIHGDLNHSNLKWCGKNPKIIDNETIKNSARLNEFESALFLEGHMEKPKYIKNSLKIIIDEYNLSSKNPLSTKEIANL
ncbi:hypothetical protein HYV49_06060, partial [Candidatus Pacearchaeota archaeon]|nr:hypothetical protein [Candidatus Pacearchaeota archaeon]